MTYRIPHVLAGSYYFPIDLCYQDTDMGGVLYHGLYLHLAERARASLLRDMGFGLDIKKTFLFFVHSCTIKYVRPIYVDDALWVKTDLVIASAVRLVFTNTFIVDGTTRATLEITVVSVDAMGRPIKVAQAVLDNTKTFLHNDKT